MRLAWRNLSYDKLRFSVTFAGIAFSVFLMIFEGSLLAGFIRASSRVIEVSGSDLWISARGVPCFECATPMPGRFRDIALGIPGIQSVQRIATGSAVWQKPSGFGQLVYVVGTEPGVGPDFPLPYLTGNSGPIDPDTVVIDRSNAAMLEADRSNATAEINAQRAIVGSVADDFGSFIGQPYVFTNYREAVRYLRMRPETVQFLNVRLDSGADAAVIRHALQRRIPEVDVWLTKDFARRAQMYWVVQTGSGSAILTAAVLGLIIGIVIVSQTTYATTMEHLDEFATLKALGASRWYIRGVVLVQTGVCGLIGAFAGLALAYPLLSIARGSIPWIFTPWWLPPSMIGVSVIMCCVASIVSVRKAVSVEPGRVFRV